jgi:release factor glutamine methyltransferase
MMGVAARVKTVGDALRDAVARLAAAGVSEPRADAEVLLAHALGTTRTSVIASARAPFPARVADAFGALVARRAAREPVHYIVGEREFWSLPFAVDRRVLVPRPETETLVETALRIGGGARRVLDVCTGSGAVAAVLARALPAARVWASDVVADALAVARTNLARHAPRVALVGADLLAAFRDGVFDLVVANPPYVAEPRFPGLAPELRDYEPRIALVREAPRVLAPGGWLVVEMSAGQAGAVRAMVEDSDRYQRVEVARDHAGIERVLAAREGRGAWSRW